MKIKSMPNTELTQLLQEVGITRKMLATLLWVDRRTIYNWERGRTGISLRTAKRWHRIFGVVPPYLEIRTPHSRTYEDRLQVTQQHREEKGLAWIKDQFGSVERLHQLLQEKYEEIKRAA